MHGLNNEKKEGWRYSPAIPTTSLIRRLQQVQEDSIDLLSR